ncbi:MAG: RNA polymerase sigma factor RpoD/SigA [Bacteroidaceae bacterium]|nr:RNA polymerase sigma factor RpoD/SigA [Bacteroidaceae bacterium]MDE6158850.1 RNA polymerase sigma factor RpoD/SigA [Bacteroidaceae bacterium]
MRQLKMSQSITARDSQAINAYLREIDRYPLLSMEEEIELAQRIRKGDVQARDKMVNSNLRFVVSVAKQYPTQGMDLMDLISEGNVGLVKAAERFDETRGFKFISYAVWWIRQAIMQAIADQGRMVRIPLNKLGEQHRIFQYIAEYEQAHEHRPSAAQIAEGVDLPEHRVNAVLGVSSRHASIDSPLMDGEDSTLVDVLPNSDTPATDKEMDNESLSTELARIMATLPERESEVLRLFYGIGCHAMTLDEISTYVGLTRERVRQIREKAIHRLKTSNKSALLRDFL